jgi:hypothetical protein
MGSNAFGANFNTIGSNFNTAGLNNIGGFNNFGTFGSSGFPGGGFNSLTSNPFDASIATSLYQLNLNASLGLNNPALNSLSTDPLGLSSSSLFPLDNLTLDSSNVLGSDSPTMLDTGGVQHPSWATPITANTGIGTTTAATTVTTPVLKKTN